MNKMKILLVVTILCIAEFTKAAEFLVTDYGAVADGTTDCSPAIAAAIEAAGAAGGGTVVLPAADKPYVITDTIHLRTDNLHFTAGGATVYLKDGSSIGRTTADNMLHIVWIHGTPERPVENVRLDGLSIDANYWGQTGNVASWQGSRAVAGITRGIKIHHARHIKIDNVAIRRPFVGMTFGLGSHYCHASNITVTEFHHDAFGVTPGYVTAGATHITYERCTAADSMNGAKGGLPGIRIKGWEIEEGAQNIKVIDCTVRNTSANGFYIRPHSAHTNFATKNIELIRCRVENAGDLAFNVQSATADQPVSNVTLTDCSTDTGNLAMQMNTD
ncbi:MAG: glycosyl hydrolase family 28-related protein, partial [Lentisphaeria bacterium]|nr:glycosyl hydrolase family 28-related protein [Lentisphaeria bacterium]